MSSLNLPSIKNNDDSKNPFLQAQQSLAQSSHFKDFFGQKTPQSTINEDSHSSLRYNFFQNTKILDELKTQSFIAPNHLKQDSFFNINNSLIFSQKSTPHSTYLKSEKKKVEIPNINTINQYHTSPEDLNIFSDINQKKDDNSISEQFKRDLYNSLGLRKQLQISNFRKIEKNQTSLFSKKTQDVKEKNQEFDFNFDYTHKQTSDNVFDERIKLNIRFRIKMNKSEDYEIRIHKNSTIEQLKFYLLTQKVHIQKQIHLPQELSKLLIPHIQAMQNSLILSDQDMLSEKNILNENIIQLKCTQQAIKLFEQRLQKTSHSFVPNFNGIKTSIDQKQLLNMTEQELKKVKDFEIFLPCIKVKFPGNTDITFVDFSTDIKFSDDNVDIYPNKDTKPQKGQDNYQVKR